MSLKKRAEAEWHKTGLFRRKQKLQSQSAMEYLMTYGWSILILAVVLALLYSLGVFNGIFGGTSSCISNEGFLCTNLRYSTNTNDKCGTVNALQFQSINVTVGTILGPWNNVYFVVVNSTAQPITDVSWTGRGNSDDIWFWGTIVGRDVEFSTLNSGQQVQANICINQPGTIGSRFNGQIWVAYSTSTVTNALAQVGTFRAVATR